MKPPLFKRTYILPDSFQYEFLTVSLLHFLIIILTFVLTLFVPLMMQLDNLSLSVAEKHGLASQFLSLHARVWPALLVVLLLLGGHSVFFSHKLAGPLYRAREMFKAIGDGNLTISTVIRKGDYLHKEMECLDGMQVSLKAKLSDITAQHREVRGSLVELKRAIESGSTTEADRNMQRLEEQLERLKAYVDQFRTTG